MVTRQRRGLVLLASSLHQVHHFGGCMNVSISQHAADQILISIAEACIKSELSADETAKEVLKALAVLNSNSNPLDCKHAPEQRFEGETRIVCVEKSPQLHSGCLFSGQRDQSALIATLSNEGRCTRCMTTACGQTRCP